jgi:hypothetical protein
MNLRSVANRYHASANALAARGDKQGKLTPSQQKGVAYYRDCAGKVEALIRPEDGSEAGNLWMLEGGEPVHLGKVTDFKVTSADKAATPQELLEKTK